MGTDRSGRDDAWNMKQVIQGLPLFFAFFMWSFGSGAIQLARPLYAFEITDSIFLVSVMVSITGVARIVAGPMTGWLTDRFGRKPLMLLGAGLRGACSLGQYFTDSYVAFIAFEFIAQGGVAIFITSVSVMISDVTTRENRGRFLAVRTLSGRFGAVAGPATGGLIATLFELRHIFLFDSITKFAIVVVILLLIRESRPTVERVTQKSSDASNSGPARFGLRTFANSTFLALGAATIAGTVLQQGVTFSILPVHAYDSVGISPGTLGALVSVAALLGMLVAYPNGMISDRYGRKWSLAPGLLLLAFGTVLLAVSPTYAALVLAMAAFGMGEGMTIGTTQAFVMDLAPEQGRGTFLGLWSLVRSTASVAVPLVIGGLYEAAGPQAAFLAAGAWLALSAALVIAVAHETAGRKRS
ncbi:MAG: MFS transporter [Chloroflexi bacterium]|nr:MFS transporter [Chloroflexota bacterium]